jgi:hypothetical protein
VANVPTLEQVRAYVRVPASALSDEDLARMRASALGDQGARCLWSGLDHPVLLAVNVQTAVVAVSYPEPGLAMRVNWGDGSEGFLTAPPDGGQAQATRTYSGGGSYAITVYPVPASPSGERIGTAYVVIPSTVPAYDITYPDALAQAMLRRVQREIAARNLPLGMVGLEAEYGPANIPAYDALVEHHEAPYRRQVLA